MPRDDEDRLFDGLVERAIVPRGFRPETDEEIEAMLNSLGHVEIGENKLHRMIDKIEGSTPMGWDVVEDQDPVVIPDSAEARELAEMYRAKGEEIPPELEELLRDMERRASELPDEDVDGEVE